MYLTDKPPPDKPALPSTVQVFSVKVAAVSAGLHWPLDVFGMMAVRDSMDHNRNIIFNRTRDNCQTLREEVRISSLFYVFAVCFAMLSKAIFCIIIGRLYLLLQ
jgi:hypothetical protein